jgi:hypothetical protein
MLIEVSCKKVYNNDTSPLIQGDPAVWLYRPIISCNPLTSNTFICGDSAVYSGLSEYIRIHQA